VPLPEARPSGSFSIHTHAKAAKVSLDGSRVVFYVEVCCVEWESNAVPRTAFNKA